MDHIHHWIPIGVSYRSNVINGDVQQIPSITWVCQCGTIINQKAKKELNLLAEEGFIHERL